MWILNGMNIIIYEFHPFTPWKFYSKRHFETTAVPVVERFSGHYRANHWLSGGGGLVQCKICHA